MEKMTRLEQKERFEQQLAVEFDPNNGVIWIHRVLGLSGVENQTVLRISGLPNEFFDCVLDAATLGRMVDVRISDGEMKYSYVY